MASVGVRLLTEKRPDSVRGLVFDMDGLLLDSEKVVKRSWDYVGNKLGYGNLGDHIFNTVGFNVNRRREYFLSNVDPNFPMDDFILMTRKKYHEIADQEGIEVKKGARELLSWANGEGYRIGLATSSREVHAKMSLKKVGLYDYFDGKIFGDRVVEGKPSPEIYLKACESIGVRPSEAIAFEDAPSGVQSAFAAGMKVVMVPDLVMPTETLEPLIWRQVEHLGMVIDLLKNRTINKKP